MKILVVGSGGREHAIAWTFLRHGEDRKIYCANGNAGISEIAECIAISPTDVIGLSDFAFQNKIDMTFIGGENSLALGIVDEFESKGLRVIGPTKAAARLESSKAFAKEFMDRHKIPTAEFKEVNSLDAGLKALESGTFGDAEAAVVIKANGLAAGKGVVVAKDKKDGKEALKAMLEGAIVSASAAESIVIEECLVGKEVSLLLFTDGSGYALMPPTRDHKRIGEMDKGDNTGGMGTVTDVSLLTPEETDQIKNEIVVPTLRGAAKEGFPIKGVLFIGLMMTADGPKVLEYNVRFGDPETQAILVNLETDLLDICDAIIDGGLEKLPILWKEGSSACVILAAENYPKSPRKGDLIRGIESVAFDECVEIFHSGTAIDEEGRLVTSGGRVLGVTSIASNLSNALHRAYKSVNKIDWDGMNYRRDIGRTSDE